MLLPLHYLSLFCLLSIHWINRTVRVHKNNLDASKSALIFYYFLYTVLQTCFFNSVTDIRNNSHAIVYSNLLLHNCNISMEKTNSEEYILLWQQWEPLRKVLQESPTSKGVISYFMYIFEECSSYLNYNHTPWYMLD